MEQTKLKAESVQTYITMVEQALKDIPTLEKSSDISYYLEDLRLDSGMCYALAYIQLRTNLCSYEFIEVELEKVVPDFIRNTYIHKTPSRLLFIKELTINSLQIRLDYAKKLYKLLTKSEKSLNFVFRMAKWLSMRGWILFHPLKTKTKNN